MLIAALVSATVPAIPFPVGKRISRVPTPWAILLQSSPFVLSRRKREQRSASTTRAAACTMSFSRRSRSRSATRAFATSSTFASFATLACKRSIGSESIADRAAASVAVRHADARRFGAAVGAHGCRGRRTPPLRDEPAAESGEGALFAVGPQPIFVYDVQTLRSLAANDAFLAHHDTLGDDVDHVD